MFIMKVANALSDYGVKYALVGGFAVSLHGAVRGTVDVDIVIGLAEEEFLKVEKAFQNLGLLSKLPVTAYQVFKFRKEYIEDRNLIAWSFYNPKNPLESVDVIITHDQQTFVVEAFKLAVGELKVASISDLIAMKEQAGRPQDLADVEALKKIVERRKNE
jgi:predicted nucleotidyltransferase